MNEEKNKYHLETGHIDSNVGIVMGKRYITHRDSRYHYFRRGLGYPISVSILRDLQSKGITTIRIIEHLADGSINVYEAPVLRYLEMPTFQETLYDRQKCLPLAAMTKLSYAEILKM